MDSINDFISGLSEEDMNDLRDMAAELFGNGEGEKKKENGGTDGSPDMPPFFADAEFIGKIMNIINGMRREDDRIRLITALRPLLGESRRRRADDAVRLIRIMDMLPLITSFGRDKNG